MSRQWKRYALMSTAAGAALLALSPRPALADALATLRAQVKKAEFQPLYPIRDDFAPGQVYTEKKGKSGAIVRNVICENLFSNHKPRISNVVLADIAVDDAKDAKASLSLSPGLFKAEASAAAKLGAAGVEKGTLRFEDPKIAGLQAAVSSSGERRAISAPCMDQLGTYFRADGTTKHKIILVSNTLSVGGLAYDMHVKKEKSGGFEAALKDIIGLNFGFNKVDDTTARLSFQASNPADRMIVGYAATRIKQLRGDTQISGDEIQAYIAADPIPIGPKAVSFTATPSF